MHVAAIINIQYTVYKLKQNKLYLSVAKCTVCITLISKHLTVSIHSRVDFSPTRNCSYIANRVMKDLPLVPFSAVHTFVPFFLAYHNTHNGSSKEY